jgi:hypothetical protein
LIAEYFEAGPAYPVILVDAVSDWPALQKWNLEFFSTNFRGDLGVASLSFDRTRSGKATKLGAYIDHLDNPFSSMPGLWIEEGGRLMDDPKFDEDFVWGFNWDALQRHPSLFDDISPYPMFIPNIVTHLSPGVMETLQYICSVKFHAIYISRKNTITPLHFDFHHTIGSLVQFQGDKTVFLFRPEDYDEPGENSFDPEEPDYNRFPRMLDRIAYSAILKPGEMIIIPPDWWHYTRSHDHSITLSHNFFNNRNFSPFIRCIFEDMERHPDKEILFEKIRDLLKSTVETSRDPPPERAVTSD